MNLGSTKPRRRALSPPPDWPAQIENWRDLLTACNRKPTRKRIHVLRVATLRLQAQVHSWLDRHDPDHPAASIAKIWTRQAKHLRRALGAPRSFDVHLAHLAQVRNMLTTSSGYEPRSSRASLRQIDALESRFKRQRKDAASNLTELLASRSDRLQQAVTAMATALPLERSLVPAISAARLSTMLDKVVSAFPRLDARSLHDFRKHLKSVRYLAEIAASGAAARQLAATVKSMQGAIGEWHDWEELAAEAKRTAHRKKAKDSLSELFASLVAESLERALLVVQNGVSQLAPARPQRSLDAASDLHRPIHERRREPATLPPSKPVQSAAPITSNYRSA